MKEQRTDVRQEDSKDGNEGRREGCVGRNKDTMEGRKKLLVRFLQSWLLFSAS